jgi:primosomal protein N' (replication factor Y) (superfamily II helicase)
MPSQPNHNLQILNVALDVPLDRLFDYANAGFNVQIGSRVVVPFAGRKLVGLVMGIGTETEVPLDKLKPVIHVFDDVPLDGAMHKLLKFCADYYHFPLGQALLSSLPVRLRQIKPAVTRKAFVYRLDKPIPESLIGRRQVLLQRLIQALQTQPVLTAQQLASVSAGWRKALQPLIVQGYVQMQEIVAVKPSMPSSQLAPQLNDEQINAIEAVWSMHTQFKPWLLYGVTGSGKTEVYIQLLQRVLSVPDAQALVLVPEINLTPQLEARFRSRLSQFPLVTLHSNLSESERLQHWQAAKTGVAKIVIGTRLSVFTPMPHLKLILMDEEHDGSYKQQDGMRYHARDVAVMRAKQANIPIVLGSATPSLETWYLAQPSAQKQQSYGLLTLTERAVAASSLPKVFCIDTAKSPVENGLSPLLSQAIAQRLQRGEQSLLFINRRGYAPVLHCNACQWTACCTRCSAKMVVHLSQKRLKCHHCGHEQIIPLQCPSCGNPDLYPVGQATQRLTQTLQQLFPHARVARVDRDSVRNKDTLTHLLSQVYAGEVDILVGTQMLAKGHDFPNLTLVGVIDTDSALYSPDFRAAERLFSQLMQVAGRAGRGHKAGEVLIQTSFPQHALFHALRAHDYTSFANALLQERISMQFPPAQYFALIKAEASDYQQVERFLSKASALAREAGTEVIVYDPVRPQLERLKSMERGQLLFQSATRLGLQRLFKALVPRLKVHHTHSKVRWAIDIDPLELT